MDERARPAWIDAVRLGLPLGVSLLVHAAILLLLVFFAWQFRGPSRPGDLGPPVMITLTPPPPRAEASPARAEPGGAARAQPAPSPAPSLSGRSASIGAAPVLRSSVADGPLPVLRPGAVQIGGASFAGLGTKRARSVVYVVDASGAMVTNFKWIKGELERSVSALSPTQKFQVVLFRDLTATGAGGTTEVFSPGAEPGVLLPATAPNKQALVRWLGGVYPSGRSNPLDGLRRGLELEPDVIFLLSRGIRRTGGGDDAGAGMWSLGAEGTLAELDRLNPPLIDGGPRTVVIKAIQFLDDDPTGIMRAIGDRHGDGSGSYRVLTLRELGER